MVDHKKFVDGGSSQQGESGEELSAITAGLLGAFTEVAVNCQQAGFALLRCN